MTEVPHQENKVSPQYFICEGLIAKRQKSEPDTSARRRPVIPLGASGGSTAGGGSSCRGTSAGWAGPSETLVLAGTVDELQQSSRLRHHAPT